MAPKSATTEDQQNEREADDRHFVTLKSRATKRRSGVRFPKDEEVKIYPDDFSKDQLEAIANDPDIKPVRD
jgi:hypothetical protein